METISTVGLMLCFLMTGKNLKTYSNRRKVISAIGNYHVHLIDNNSLSDSQVEYKDIESYYKTLFRIWDWGCTRILPKEKFEIIKPFMK